MATFSYSLLGMIMPLLTSDNMLHRFIFTIYFSWTANNSVHCCVLLFTVWLNASC